MHLQYIHILEKELVDLNLKNTIIKLVVKKISIELYLSKI